tara:strand:+ start:254 stop:676 length:423 start_codon:yes stop_codon:yes gene_type:complete
MKENKKNLSSSISLTFRDQFDVSDLFINSYGIDKIEINNKTYNFPLCIFGQKVFELNLNKISNLSTNHMKNLITVFYKNNNVYPELILIGLKDYDWKKLAKIKKICDQNKIGFDVMKIGQASGTFNFLTLEKREFITIFI